MSFFRPYALCLVAIAAQMLALSASSCAQTAKTIEEDIAKAKSHAADLVAISQSLPDRWSTLQRRQTIVNNQLGKKPINVERVEEVWATDRLQNVSYTRVVSGERSARGSFDENSLFHDRVLIRTSGKQVLYKIGEGTWDTEPKLPGNDGRYPYTDVNLTFPLNWSLGLVSSAKIGFLRKSDYLKNLLLEKRTCIYAQPDDQGNLVAFWGWENAKTDPASGRQPMAYRIVFSKDGLVSSYSLVRSEETSKENLAKKNYKTLEEGAVTWKKFPNMGKDGQAITLPVRVEIQSTFNEQLECTNDITWIFGKAVPDSVFVDPKMGIIEEPDFDP